MKRRRTRSCHAVVEGLESRVALSTGVEALPDVPSLVHVEKANICHQLHRHADRLGCRAPQRQHRNRYGPEADQGRVADLQFQVSLKDLNHSVPVIVLDLDLADRARTARL